MIGIVALFFALLITVFGFQMVFGKPKDTHRTRTRPRPKIDRHEEEMVRRAERQLRDVQQRGEQRRDQRQTMNRLLGNLFEHAIGRNLLQGADHAGMVIEFIAAPNGVIIDNRPAETTDVHDHAIQETIKKSYSKLEQWIANNPQQVISIPDTMKQVKAYLFKNEDDTEKIEKSYSTLKNIKKHNGFLHSIKRSEQEVLSHVWSRIQSPVNKEVKGQLCDHLMELLAEASINFDNDLSRCLTGRISRMIQSLESIDAEDIVNIVSSSVIKRELNEKMPLLVNKYMDSNWTVEQRQKYNEEDPVLAKQLREYVEKQLETDYLDSNLLTPKQFKALTAPYLDAI